MTSAEKDSVLLVFSAAGKDLQLAMGREDITDEQAPVIMGHLAYIFGAVADTRPDMTTKQAIDRAVWCAYNEIPQKSIQQLLSERG